MNIQELKQSLYELNEVEIFYKNCYIFRNDPIQLQKCIDDVDEQFIEKNYLTIPDSHNYDSISFKEDMFFIRDSNIDIMLMKHNRYSPVFPHSHNFFEMVYVLDGSCKHTVGETSFPMYSGDLCIVSPMITHSISVFDESIIINLLIRSSTFEHIFLNLLRGDNIISNFFLNNIYSNKINAYIMLQTGNDLELQNLLLDIMLEYENQSPYYSEIINAGLPIFFAKTLRSYEHTCRMPSFTKKADVQSYALIRYIHENYKTVTLQNIAKKFHYSKDYASRLIKTTTGHTFTQLHTKIRMHRAEMLLNDTNRSIQDICDEVGYQNPEHFIRTFKKIYHMTPGEYRKRAQI